MLLSCTTCGPAVSIAGTATECRRCQLIRISSTVIEIVTIAVLVTCLCYRSSSSTRGWYFILGMVLLINGSKNMVKAQFKNSRWLIRPLSLVTTMGGLYFLATAWIRR